MITIDSNNKYLSISTGKGDIAVVLQSYANITKWLTETAISPRLSGLFYIYANDVEMKIIPLKDLRIGWKRVLKEIELFAPLTKRIFVLCDTNLLNVCMPALKLHPFGVSIEDAHGSIFTLENGMELVPTFTFDNYKLEHIRIYMERDVLRLLKLTKPKEPLEYKTKLPEFI